MLRVFGTRESGHAYKVRLFLKLAGVAHHYVPVDISVPREQRPEPFRTIAKFGEVPVLVDDGQVLVQSNAILLHLAAKTGHFGWQTDSGRDEITSWLFWEANRIGRSYPNLRWFKLFQQGDAELVRWLELTGRDDMARLDQELAQKPFLTGSFSIADISCAAYLLYGDQIGLDPDNYPHIAKWLDRIRSLPGWQHPYRLLTEAENA